MAQVHSDERREREAIQKARGQADREREEAERRKKYLADLLQREEEAWQSVDALIAKKQAKQYDDAVSLLVDLREMCASEGRMDEAVRRFRLLMEVHAKSRMLMNRFRKAGRC